MNVNVYQLSSSGKHLYQTEKKIGNDLAKREETL